VSNYLNDTKPVSARTRVRVEKAIADLRFVPNNAGRVMRGARNGIISFIASDAPDPFFVTIAKGIEDAVRVAGYVVVLCNTEGVVEREKQFVDALAAMRVVGAVVVPAFTGAGEDHLNRLRDAGAAIVLCGADEGDYDACGVSTDDVRGGRLALEHLISLGHTTFVFVGGPGGERQMRDRFTGASAAVAAAGLPTQALQRIDATGVSTAARAEVGQRIAALPIRPRAIFCASDSLALAVAGTLSRIGIRVPEDIAIVGYNNIDQAELAPIPITTIALPQYEIGRMAGEMLLSELEAGHVHRRLVLQPRLIVRESTMGSR